MSPELVATSTAWPSTAPAYPPHQVPQAHHLAIHSLGMGLCTCDSGVVRHGPAGMAGADPAEGPGALERPGAGVRPLEALTMIDRSSTRPLARRDRDDRLRAAARLLEHLADGDVPPADVGAVEAAAVNLCKQALGEERF